MALCILIKQRVLSPFCDLAGKIVAARKACAREIYNERLISSRCVFAGPKRVAMGASSGKGKYSGR